jgi:hypothetical protein
MIYEHKLIHTVTLSHQMSHYLQGRLKSLRPGLAMLAICRHLIPWT